MSPANVSESTSFPLVSKALPIYTVKVVEEKVIPVHLSNTKNKKGCMMGAKLSPSINTIFPIYHPREIQVGIDETSAAIPGIPRKVFINGQLQPSFYKIVYSGDVTGTTREITAYSRIHMANFDPTVLTSELNGIVQDDKGNILGLLLSYIECGGATLYRIDGQDPNGLIKFHTRLSAVHEPEIIWGDAKAANVLLEFNGDAYLVDFGGEYTKGWVEKEKSNSIERDLQGLGNIKRWLFNFES
ncbi:uncharacterized protein N7503_002822 [Penicillium pulvis]|uniref:uncharacterized protein n=1 Tax=Penicillium pulvis TaxID=1562058 RepID=UPI0025483A64|nr:uncharacterized protein N7503_002822 [Penicillium pulvis]KAJ5810604.1 hypothetical protein N7503_002822 [Penicillium pulvis]